MTTYDADGNVTSGFIPPNLHLVPDTLSELPAAASVTPLCQRLEEGAESIVDWGRCENSGFQEDVAEYAALMREAATQVEALETRVAILETRLRLALGAIVDAHKAFKALLQEAIAIEAELERK